MSKFADCTVITIAHRLITISEYDKVLVMKDGMNVEYDHPFKLLASNEGDRYATNSEGIFYGMVQNCG